MWVECRSLEDVRDREVDAEVDVVVEVVVVVVVVGYARGGYGPSDGESPRRGDEDGEIEEKGSRGDEERGSIEGEGGEETSGMIGIDRDVASGCGGARRVSGLGVVVAGGSCAFGECSNYLSINGLAMAMAMLNSKLRGMGCKRANERQCKHQRRKQRERMNEKTKAHALRETVLHGVLATTSSRPMIPASHLLSHVSTFGLGTNPLQVSNAER